MRVLKLNPLNRCFAAALFALCSLFISPAWAELFPASLWMETECPLENISPVTDDNGINFIVDTCGNITARDRNDLLWTHALGERVKAQPALNHDGSLCIVTYFGNLYCFDAQGGVQWQITISLKEDEKFIHAPLTDSKGRVFVVTNQGRTFCMENGTKKWSRSLTTTGQISAVLSSKYLIVGDEQGKVHFIDKSGNKIKEIVLGGVPTTRPSLSHNSLYFITNSSADYYLNILSLDMDNLGNKTRKKLAFAPLEGVTPLIDLDGTLWILTDNGVTVYKGEDFEDIWSSKAILPLSPVLMGDHLCFLTSDNRMNAITMPPSDTVTSSALNVHSISSDISGDLSGNLYVTSLSQEGKGQVWRYKTYWELDAGDPWPMAGQYPGYGRGEWYDYSLNFIPDITSTTLPLQESGQTSDKLYCFADLEVVATNTGKTGLSYSIDLSGSASGHAFVKDSTSDEVITPGQKLPVLDADEERRFTIQCDSRFKPDEKSDLKITFDFPDTYIEPVTHSVTIDSPPPPDVDLDPSAGYAAKCIASDGVIYCISGKNLYRINQNTMEPVSVELPFPGDAMDEYMEELLFYTERPALTIAEGLLYVTAGSNFAVYDAATLELLTDYNGLFKDNLHMLIDSDKSVYLVREDDKNIIHIDDINEEISDIKSKELEDPEPERGVFVKPLMVEKGSEKRLYVPGRDGKLTVWQNDSLLYKFQAGGALMASPVLAGCGQILLPSWDGFLYVLGWNEEPSKPGEPEGYLEEIAKINFNQPLDHSPFIIKSNGISNSYMVTGKGDLFRFQLGGSYEKPTFTYDRIDSFNLPDTVPWWHSDVAYSDKSIIIAFYPAFLGSFPIPRTPLVYQISLKDHSVQPLNDLNLNEGEVVLDIVGSESQSLFFMTSSGKVIHSKFSETFITNNSHDIAVFDENMENLSILLDPGIDNTMKVSITSHCFCKNGETADLNFKSTLFDYFVPSVELNQSFNLDFKSLPEDHKGEWTLKAYSNITDIFMSDEVDFTIE